MNKEEYDKVVEELTEDRKQVAKGKREDYTKGDEDVLKNFKNQAEALGVDPKVSLAVHMEKQFSAVMNYIKTDGQSESEPIIKRIGDCINYLELLWGLIREERDATEIKPFDPNSYDIEELIIETPRFCKDDRNCTYDACDCDDIKACVENRRCLKSTSAAIEQYGGEYIVDDIVEYGEGYEVQHGDIGARFKYEQIKGVYGDDTKINKIKMDDGRVYKVEEKEYKLCYVENGTAFFTSDFENVWGDDWNDVPYEHNAGFPYDKFDIKTIDFYGEFDYPHTGSSLNSNYSVEMINDGDMWWLFNRDKKSQLYAGATIQEFQDYIKKCNGFIRGDELNSTGRSAGI